MFEKELLNRDIKLLDLKSNELLNITIVADENKNALDNKISVKSPVGQALCNVQNKIGCVFEVIIGNNKNRYKLMSIEYNKKKR
nr:GreA/GreB family elongation factor [Clostridium sp. SM-530-WT-3G]